jgi:hypothetical protein
LERSDALILPKPVWEALRTVVKTDYIKTNTLVSKVREKLSEEINYKVGTGEGIVDAKGTKLGLDIQKLREITNSDKDIGLIVTAGSRGSVFEHWVRMKVPMKNEGKQIFYFEVAYKNTNKETRTPIDKTAWDALTVKRDAIKTQLDATTDADVQANLIQALAALPEPKTRLIDCSYADGGGTLNKEKGARNRIKKSTQNYTFRGLRISISKKMTQK